MVRSLIDVTDIWLFCCQAGQAASFTADVRQPWTNPHDLYIDYLIIRFDYLIIPFDYWII